jgi:hypothetical protein
MPSSPSGKPDDMAHIDLSLAINYLPAVSCILKTLLMSSTLIMVTSEHNLGVFTIFAMLLNLDKVVSGERIFNGNAVLCLILLSWFLNYLRVGMKHVPVFTGSVSVFWAIFSLTIILEPARVRRIIATDSWGDTTLVNPKPHHWNLKRLGPSIVNTLWICLISFTHLEEETGSFKIARSLSFSILCVAWVYIVGVWQRCGQTHMAIFTQNLLARFSPILFSPPLVCLGFIFVCVFALLYLYVEHHCGGFKSWNSPGPAQDPQETSSMLEKGVPYEEVGRAPEKPFSLEGRRPPYEEASRLLALTGNVRLDGIAEEPVFWPGAHNTEPGVDYDGGYADSHEITQEPDEDLEACFRAACQAKGQ